MAVARPVRMRLSLFTCFRSSKLQLAHLRSSHNSIQAGHPLATGVQRAYISTEPQDTQEEDTAPTETETPSRKPQDSPRPPDIKSAIATELVSLAEARGIPLPPELQEPSADAPEPRLPRSVQALYLAPLRRRPTHGIPVCNLQLRSYSVRNLEFMADFALRAAYYLNLPAKGPVPLPRKRELWTVPRSSFIFKKSQENYERITLRRLVQIQDGHPEVVQKWLAFIRKWNWYGVGMKADVWEWEELNVGERMDNNEEAVKRGLESVNWDLFGRRKGLETEEQVRQHLAKQTIGQALGTSTSRHPAS